MPSNANRPKYIIFPFILISGLGIVVGSIWREAYWLAAVIVLVLLCLIFARALLKIYRRVVAGMFELGRGSFEREIFAAVDLQPRQTRNTNEQATKILLIQLQEQQTLNQELTMMNQRLEELVQKRTQTLEQSNMARRRLLANISHDLRTPLTSIQGYVEAMLDGVIASPEATAQYLNLIYTKALVINRLIKQLSELSQLEARQVALKLQTITPDELISQVCAKYQEDVKMAGLHMTIAIKREVHQRELTLLADTDYIERVYANLIFNSIRHTLPGGTIQLRLLPIATTDKCVTFAVEDSGEGVKQEQVDFIFDRYYQGSKANRKTENSGLGLSIAKEIITAHGGDIWAESPPGTGLAVYFTLPIAN